MIKNQETARQISKILLDVSGLLDESAAVMTNSDCSDEEKSIYLLIVGQLMGSIGLDILNGIYTEHPALLPEGYYLPGVSNRKADSDVGDNV